MAIANDKSSIQQKLREWVCQKNGKVTMEQVQTDTPILELRLINSLQIMDLILYIEHLTGEPIRVENIKSGAFSSIAAIWDNFFLADAPVCV
jgi:acyl carrier protein